MDDEECYEEVQQSPGRLNWADVAYAAIWPARGFFEGCANACRVMHSVLELHSADIGERQEFAKTGGRAIEALTRGED